jgi:hypothetical protein
LVHPGPGAARPRRSAAGRTRGRPPGSIQAGILHGDNEDIPAFRWFGKERGRNLANVYFTAGHERMRAITIEEHYRGLLHALVAHPGISFVMVAASQGWSSSG